MIIIITITIKITITIAIAIAMAIRQVLFTSKQPRENKMAFVAIFSQIKLLFGPRTYSACVVYTKTIIHLSVGKSGG